jgi:hypothetical protein
MLADYSHDLRFSFATAVTTHKWKREPQVP